MAICPECGTVHMPSARTCRNCGAELSRAEPPPQPAPDEDKPDEQEALEATQEPRQSASPPAGEQAPGQPVEGKVENIPEALALTLIVIGPGQRIRLQGPGEFTLGRTDPENDIYVTVDLSDYGAWEAGVSRRHARIYTAEGRFWLEDMQSANGTFLNEEYLASGQFRPLQAGDLIKLGILRLYIASIG